MALIFNWWFLDFVVLVTSVLVGLFLYIRNVYSYWENRGVPFLKPSFPLGNLGGMFRGRRQVGVEFGEFYKQLERNKFGGVYQLHKPTLVLRDLDVIKSFLVKDFSSFQERGIYFDEENDPLSAHLFLMGGAKWKEMRTKLTPTFTSGKMKMMFDTILRCGTELSECVRSEADLGETIEVKDLVARYSTDVIASCAFGIQCNCLKDPDAEFRQMGRAFFERSVLTSIGFSMAVFAPAVAKFFKLARTPEKISTFFRKIVRETVEYREQNDVTRNDFMQLLIQLKNKGFVEAEPGEDKNVNATKTDGAQKMTMDGVAAQAFVFFLAGFETSSTTASFCLYELAVNPDIQTRLRTEIDCVLANHGGSLTYEAMMDMEYLAMVIDETLRKYPAGPTLRRNCNKAYTIPETGLVVEPDTSVVVPVYGLHHDPKFYPDPEMFDPQRFTAENKAARNQYSYLPFGAGPKNCIGMRFGLMQVKVALISLLTRYEFHISEKTIIPPVFDHKVLILTTKDGLFLKIKNRP